MARNKQTLSYMNRMIDCCICGKRTHETIDGISGLDMCRECRKEAEAENHHNDHHDSSKEVHADCKWCVRETSKHEVFGLDAYMNGDDGDEPIDEHSRFTTTLYDDQKQAEYAAKRWFDELVKRGYKDLTVYLIIGQYKMPSGDVYGEPTLIPVYPEKT